MDSLARNPMTTYKKRWKRRLREEKSSEVNHQCNDQYSPCSITITKIKLTRVVFPL